MKKYLPQVTLAAMTSVKIQSTIKALLYSMKKIEFGEVVLITHERPLNLPDGITYKYIDELKCIDDFNYDILFKLWEYIETEYVLLVHYDGFVVNPRKWDDYFLKYDYIGSPWKEREELKDKNGNICRVGNSVSLRSKKLLEFPYKNNLPWELWEGCRNEDTYLCCYFKHELEKNGIKIAPFEIAIGFGREATLEENKNIDPFVFHGRGYINNMYPDFESKGKYKLIAMLKRIKWYFVWFGRKIKNNVSI